MSLLTRLGRKDGTNVQVIIFESAQAEEETDKSYQTVKTRVHNRIVQEMDPGEQAKLSNVHTSPQEIERIIEKYCQRVAADDPTAIPRGEWPKLVKDIRDEMLGLGPIESLR